MKKHPLNECPTLARCVSAEPTMNRRMPQNETNYTELIFILMGSSLIMLWVSGEQTWAQLEPNRRSYWK